MDCTGESLPQPNKANEAATAASERDGDPTAVQVAASPGRLVREVTGIAAASDECSRNCLE